MKKTIRTIIITILFLSGLSLLLYPYIANEWNDYRQSRLISSYVESVENLDTTDYEKIWQEARKYNKRHTVNRIVDAFDEESDYEPSHPYDTMLDPNGDGLMGSIEIPKLNQRIAIYHGLGTDVLEKGCGHVEGTSLPIGGKGTHAALAAHRGLPSAKLFTDLDQMEVGDLFILNIMDKKLAYQVDQIETVLPYETENLAIDENEDYVTLITCTPYAVNTHRLLVRGTRIPYVEEEVEKQEKQTISKKAASVDPGLFLAVGLAAVVITIIIMSLVIRRKKGEGQ